MKFKKHKKSYEKLNKIESAFVKLYSEEEMALIKALDVDKLKDLVASTNAHVLKAKKEMENNPEYKAAKEIMDTFREGFNETKKYSDAKKMLCLLALQTQGIVDIGSEEENG